VTAKVEESKKCSDNIKQDIVTLKTGLEKLKEFEKDIINMKKDSALDKISLIEKEMLSLRVDHEKSLKEVKSLSTEVKFIDSNIKKESSSNKSEITTVTKSLKGKEKFNEKPRLFLLFLKI